MFQAVFLAITLTFSILTVNFVHNNTINNHADQYADFKTFGVFESFLEAAGILLPASLFIFNGINVKVMDVIPLIIRLLIFIPPALTPTVTIILLKPVRA